jgi:YesN/AraC family two-component response regulator
MCYNTEKGGIKTPPKSFFENNMHEKEYKNSNGGEKMTIVCVDDHPIMLKGLSKNIRQMFSDAVISTFEYADDALDFVKENGCDVLICEIELCGMDGLTLAKNIKKLNPEVNIIFLTVCDEKEYAREVLRIKPSGYLVKPAKNEQIEAELKNLRYHAS